MRWACSSNREKRNACKLLVENQEEMRPLARPKCRCVDNIKMDLGQRDWGWCGLDWSGLE
jgi:hypothetical protein